MVPEKDEKDSAGKDEAPRGKPTRAAKAEQLSEPVAAESLLGQIVDLSDVDLPDWLVDKAGRLVRQAEENFEGVGKGRKKKSWAVEALRNWLRNDDIEQLPDWIEGPLETFFLSLAVQIAYRLSGLRKAKPAPAKAA
jgi:hypothetical protein